MMRFLNHTHLLLQLRRATARNWKTGQFEAAEYRISKRYLRVALASYPGHVGGGKSGLVSTVCACANDSGNFSRTRPIMDKLHVVVMRRDNQTRYTACSVAAVFTRR